MLSDAEEKRHSTTSEAIASAKAMGAKFLMMNHFSQRYPKIPSFEDSDNLSIAFDLMSISPRHFKILPLLLPCLRAMFVQQEEEEGDT